jgi:sentrin-specific protease 1
MNLNGYQDHILKRLSIPFIPAIEIQRLSQILMGAINNDIIVTNLCIPLSSATLARLIPGGWLNDDIIDLYMAMLQIRDRTLMEAGTRNRPSCFFNCKMVDLLIANGDPANYNYSNVQRWYRHLDLMTMDKVIIPINIRNTHWALAVIQPMDRSIQYYDSLSSKGKVYTDALARWMNDRTNFSGLVTWDCSCPRILVPQQTNDYDCGVFTVCCADRLAIDLDLDYTQQDMSTLRIKIGTDLLRGSILIERISAPLTKSSFAEGQLTAAPLVFPSTFTAEIIWV